MGNDNTVRQACAGPTGSSGPWQSLKEHDLQWELPANTKYLSRSTPVPGVMAIWCIHHWYRLRTASVRQAADLLLRQHQFLPTSLIYHFPIFTFLFFCFSSPLPFVLRFASSSSSFFPLPSTLPPSTPLSRLPLRLFSPPRKSPKATTAPPKKKARDHHIPHSWAVMLPPCVTAGLR